jgi:nucleolar MIF4G domain-containing protein 1
MTGGLAVIGKSRKERRREERLEKKKKRQRPTNFAAVDDDKDDRRLTKKEETNVYNATKKSKAMKFSKRQTLKSSPSSKKRKSSASSLPYAHLDPDVAAAMRRDDQEIADLEAKLGREKSRLHREYAKLECYGDDFGEFLDRLDDLVERVVVQNDDSDDSANDETREKHSFKKYKSILDDDDDHESGQNRHIDDDEIDEEEIPMKEPAVDGMDEDDSILDELEAMRREEMEQQINDENDADGFSEQDHQQSEDDSESDNDDNQKELDHDEKYTYRPVQGEDIYGNVVASSESNVPSKKYVPPHLRNKASTSEVDNDKEHQETIQTIQKLLNNSLNRLSEDTVISVSQSISKLYDTNPTTTMNECIWKNMQNACISRGQQMAGLIPVYVATLAGIHLQNKDNTMQLGPFLIEKTVLALWNQLQISRKSIVDGNNKPVDDDNDDDDDGGDEFTGNKEVCNLILILCYLYNYAILHCSLLYDVIRNLIESLSEVDIEALLLILSHCGRTLRSDDPMALKEIVLMVQKKTLKELSSRADYLVQCVLDLKNNKRRKQDEKFNEKTTKLRKALGSIKSSQVFQNKGTSSSDSALRVSLQDILDVETKGRWWKVGASWTGNQNMPVDHSGVVDKSGNRNTGPSSKNDEHDEKLLKLAAKHRMNTDTRRSIFCIIMGSSDFEDCFEKLVRAGILKNRLERETVRVLLECCTSEKTYNKYYSHLAGRICEYQVQCKFSFQLAFWDTFKQLDQMAARKVANLAKLLFHLVAVHSSIKLNVLKTIDMSAPEDMDESTIIFLAIFLSNVLEYFESPADVSRLFGSITSQRNIMDDAFAQDELGHLDDSEALRANITIFLLKIMKASPKYKKGSRYRTNLKAVIKACDTDNFF